MNGMFIVIEGCEGGGKSTAVNTVHKYLLSIGVKEEDIVHTREPGGTPIAEELRNILKTINEKEKLTSEAELLLMYASRIQLIKNVIEPAIKSGKFVIGDSHDLSSVAYQGAGRGIDRAIIDEIRRIVLKGFKPDLTLVLDLAPEIGLSRAKKRGELDRFEVEDIEFFNRIRQCFLDEAKLDPTNIKVVDASLSLEEVTSQILNILKDKVCIHG